MPKRTTAARPTEEEIRAYANVPTETAARYLGVSGVTVRMLLQQGTCPFGAAAHNEETDSWAYIVPPEALIHFAKEGKGAIPAQKWLNLIADMVSSEVEARTTAAMDAVKAVLGPGR